MTRNQLQLRAALTGSFDKEVTQGREAVETALQEAVFDYSATLQSKWRQDVAQSGLRNAQRMTRTIRLNKYKNDGLDPATLVFSNFPLLQRAFEQSTTVRSKEGNWIIIPNPDVWPQGRIRRGGGKRANKSETSFAIAERRFGPLRWVRLAPDRAMLVANARKSRTKTGAYRYASATALKRGNVEEIVVFFVVKEARLPRMLRGNVIRNRAERDAPSEIDRLFVRYFEQGGPRLLTGPSND